MEMKKVMVLMENVVFCYACKKGQGFVKKDNCHCFKEGEVNCKAFEEKNEFHKRYKELESMGFTRKKILVEIESSFNGKESHWFQYNVEK